MPDSFEKKAFFKPERGHESSGPVLKNDIEHYPDYEEKFGHLAEGIVRSALGRKNFFVDKVEKGTNFEDYEQKVDFWIQVKEMEDPLGIQFTTNPEKYKEKKDFLRKRNYLAKKEKRDDSEIKWEGNANVVVILANHAKMIEYWKKMEIEGLKPEDVVSDAFIRDFFNKILIELSEANPAKRSIVLEKIKSLARDALKNKRAGK